MAMGKPETSEKSKISSKKKEKDVLPTKIVMRRLPASLTEDDLKGIFAGAPEFDFFRFVPADYSLLPYAFSRAYISFKRFEDLTMFRNAFDGFIFNAGKGDESSAVVEIAPFQGIPKDGKKRKDPKCGTITKDSDYEAFLENLSKKVEPFPSAEVYVEQMELNKTTSSTEKVQTPLTEFLNKKKAARNLSRQNAAMLENERKMKREKESSKSRNDDKISGKDSSSRKEKDFGKSSQDKRTSENRRKEERRERRSGSAKKGKSERENKDHKKADDENDRPLSVRSDTSRRGEGGRINKREERRPVGDRRSYDDRRNRDERREKDEINQQKMEDQKKPSRAEASKEGEQRSRRKSIECEDQSIIAFGKFDDGKEPEKYGGKSQGKDWTRSKDGESSAKQRGGETKGKENRRNDHQIDDGERKIRTKARPEMAVYRPPVARQDRGKAKDERPSPDKGRIKSPTGTKSPEKKERAPDRSYQRDRYRPVQKEQERDNLDQGKDKDRDRNREKERRIREQERREREKKKDKDGK